MHGSQIFFRLAPVHPTCTPRSLRRPVACELMINSAVNEQQGISTILAHGKPIPVSSWNVESGGSDAETIADQLAEFADYDLLGLSEVQFNTGVEFASKEVGRRGQAPCRAVNAGVGSGVETSSEDRAIFPRQAPISKALRSHSGITPIARPPLWAGRCERGSASRRVETNGEQHRGGRSKSARRSWRRSGRTPLSWPPD